MLSLQQNPYNERKRTLLKFVLGTPEEQQTLFRDIIYKELDERKKFMDYKQDDTIKEYNNKLNEMIYNNKISAIKMHTDILKEQIFAQSKGTKHPSTLSIIERKLYIIELQIDVGIYNMLQNKNVNFYFET